MEYKDFMELVRQMRDQQKVYFMTRSPKALYAAKALEIKVDKAIIETKDAEDY